MRTHPGRSALLTLGLLASLLAGCLGPDTRPKIVINFGLYPEEFEGLEVLIDGEPAGKLERFGQNPRTAFLVDKGEHTVCVKHDRLACEPVTLQAELSTQRIELMMDIAELALPDGRIETRIVFQ